MNSIPRSTSSDVTAVEYEPDSGYADPNATVFSFARAATALGVEFKLGTRVLGIMTEGGRVTGVETSAGIIQTPTVVVAAGGWANQLFTPLGIDLGLVPIEAQVVVFRWAAERSPRHLTYIDSINHSWMRPIDGNCTLIGSEGGVKLSPDPDAYPETVRAEYIEQCRAALIKRVPTMQHSTMRGNWAGLLMFSPDSRPIIDKLPQYEGPVLHDGRQRHLVQDQPRDRQVPRGVGHAGAGDNGRSDAVPLHSLRRGGRLDRRVRIRHRPQDDLPLASLSIKTKARRPILAAALSLP